MGERNRLDQITDGKYKCSIEDYINEEYIDTVTKKNVLNLVPGVMTGLGILGTFIGLSFGLQNFNTGTSEQIASSIAPLMNGIKVAFHTSIYGMLSSLIFNYIYKETLEDAYLAMDNFLRAFDKYVDSNAESDNKSTIQNMIQQMPSAIGEHIAEILTPAVDRMNDTLENFTKNIADSQVKGVAEIVDRFMAAMNTSLGDSFNRLGETIDRICKMQDENADTMVNILSKVKDMTENIININDLSNKTIEKMSGYVSEIEKLQKIITENFASASIQLQYQKDYDEKLKGYLEILVNYERQIGEASSQFTEDMSKQLEILAHMEEKISESTRKNLEELANKADGYNKALTESAKQELQVVLSLAEEYSEKVTLHLNAIDEMNDRLTNEAEKSIELLSENVQKQNHSLEDMHRKMYEESDKNLQILSTNAQKYTETLANEAKRQIEGVLEISNSHVSDMDRASKELSEVSCQLNDKLSASLTNAFKVIDENMAEITRHLSGTILEIEETTERVPQVVKSAYDGMKESFDDMKKKYEALIHALDLMVVKLDRYDENNK